MKLHGCRIRILCGKFLEMATDLEEIFLLVLLKKIWLLVCNFNLKPRREVVWMWSFDHSGFYDFLLRQRFSLQQPNQQILGPVFICFKLAGSHFRFEL